MVTLFSFCLDSIVKNAIDDPKFSKLYPIITNQKLLNELIRFIKSPSKKSKVLTLPMAKYLRKKMTDKPAVVIVSVEF